MVAISVVRATISQLSTQTTPAIAVFVGGTSGIGRFTLLELARRKISALKVYIVGRNATAQQPLLDELHQINSTGSFVFAEAQITLLADIKRVCDEIKTKEKFIDLLWLSSGALPFAGRKETPEGLSLHVTLAYWGRMFFAVQLLPLLNASPSGYARVVSILRAGKESLDADLSDIDLRSKTGLAAADYMDAYAHTVETANTLFLEALASRNPRVVFVHKFPGLVKTPLFGREWEAGKWSARRLLFSHVVPLTLKLFGMSGTEVGERMVYTLTSARFGGKGVTAPGINEENLVNLLGEQGTEGAFLVKEDDEAVVNAVTLQELREKGAVERVWEDTNRAFRPYS